MRFIALLLLVFACCSLSNAQNGWTIYNTGNTSLLDNTIKAVAIDQNHRKWVGTSYGLGVYNDTSWTLYTSANSGLPDDNITSIKIDANNAAWIGTNNGGLAKFDGTNWTVWNTTNSLLPSDEIKCIAFDTLGNKWLGTANGMAMFNDTVFTYWNLNNTGLFLVNIKDIAVDKNNVKYISSLNSGIFVLDDTTFTNYNVQNSYLQDNFVNCIVLDTNQTRWYGTAGKSLMAQHTDTVTWEWYYPGNTPACTAWTVYCILIDSLQRKYMGTELTGLVRYDGTNWTYWQTNNSPIPSNKVLSITQESNGAIWLGTTNGLARFMEQPTMNQEALTTTVEVFPNPAEDMIHIQTNTKDLQVELMNAMGEKIWKQELQEGKNDINLKANNIHPGIYFYRLLSKEGCVGVGSFRVR